MPCYAALRLPPPLRRHATPRLFLRLLHAPRYAAQSIALLHCRCHYAIAVHSVCRRHYADYAFHAIRTRIRRLAFAQPRRRFMPYAAAAATRLLDFERRC